MAKAKAANMPNENIQRSIKKAAGEGDAAYYKEITYEGYAPGGVAVIVEVVTDNLNRTASEVRHIFDKCGGSLGATGCVSWKFERKGVIEVDNDKGLDEDEMMMIALDAGAADVEYGRRHRCDLHRPQRIFSGAGESGKRRHERSFPPNAPWCPPLPPRSPTPKSAAKVQKLLDWLDDYDDTQEVYHDAELPEEEEEE